MKRTKRVTFLCNEVEIAQLTILKEKYHLSTRSGLIRMLIFSFPQQIQQYIPTANPQIQQYQKPKRILSPIPGTPQYLEMENIQNNQEVIIELKVRLADRKKQLEEELLREVEIK